MLWFIIIFLLIIRTRIGQGLSLLILFAILMGMAGEDSHSETLRCSQWNDTTTCTGSGGYVSHENKWGDFKFGSDNQGNRWTTSKWRDTETTEFHH